MPVFRSRDHQRMFQQACREMAPWDRQPAIYLINSLLDPDKVGRRWLGNELATIARVTRMREHDVEQDERTLPWDEHMTLPPIGSCIVRILLNREQNAIFNAYVLTEL